MWRKSNNAGSGYLVATIPLKLDRAVKIWALPPTLDPSRSRLTRIDKPIFSCTSIHRARVRLFLRLSEELLLSHSAPVRHTFEPGELILWQWLALKRFFPPQLPAYQQQLRPMSSDYWGDSSSFRVFSRKIIPSPAGIS
jgi:polycomb protein EED